MKNYIEELEQQFPTLYSVMEKTEVFGIPIAVRFSEWFEQAIQSAKKEAVEKEICICAAIKTEDGKVVRGHRHGDCFIYMDSHKLKILNSIQGFITSKNRFVDREEGRKLQDLAGIKSADQDGYRGNTLFSEDLY